MVPVGTISQVQKLASVWGRARQRWSSSLPGHGWRRAREVDLATLTLALGAQQIVCTAPLLVAASAVARRVSGRGLAGLLTNFLGLHGTAAQDVTTLFSSPGDVSTTKLVFGLLTSALFGTGIAATQQRGYEIIWSQPRAGLISILRQWAWVLGLLGYLLVVIGMARLGHLIGWGGFAAAAMRGVALFITSLLFSWWSQHLLLCGRIRWRSLLPGATCMAIGMTALVVGSALVLPGQITRQAAEYGPVAVAFLLSTWLLFLSGVVFGGALLGAVIVENWQATHNHQEVPEQSARRLTADWHSPAERPR